MLTMETARRLMHLIAATNAGRRPTQTLFAQLSRRQNGVLAPAELPLLSDPNGRPLNSRVKAVRDPTIVCRRICLPTVGSRDLLPNATTLCNVQEMLRRRLFDPFSLILVGPPGGRRCNTGINCWPHVTSARVCIRRCVYCVAVVGVDTSTT